MLTNYESISKSYIVFSMIRMYNRFNAIHRCVLKASYTLDRYNHILIITKVCVQKSQMALTV